MFYTLFFEKPNYKTSMGYRRIIRIGLYSIFLLYFTLNKIKNRQKEEVSVPP